MAPRSPKLFRVHPWDVRELWPKIKDRIETALGRSNSDFTSEHVRKKLDAGKAQLWVIADDEIRAVGVSEFVRLENGRTLCVVSALAGDDLAVWDHTWEQFEGIARQQGCDGIQIVGRVGWIRYMKRRGFEQPWCVLEKKL